MDGSRRRRYIGDWSRALRAVVSPLQSLLMGRRRNPSSRLLDVTRFSTRWSACDGSRVPWNAWLRACPKTTAHSAVRQGCRADHVEERHVKTCKITHPQM